MHNLIWALDSEVPIDQPTRSHMNLSTVIKWQKVKELSVMNKRFITSKIRDMTDIQVGDALTEAVKDMNNWIFKKSTGEHPNNVFVNFLKKSLAKQIGSMSLLENECKHGFSPSNLIVDIRDGRVADLHFYENQWPAWGKGLLTKVRAHAATMDYKKLEGPALEVSSIKEAMAGLDKLANFSFKL